MSLLTTASLLHDGLNTIGITLFCWAVLIGIPITAAMKLLHRFFRRASERGDYLTGTSRT